MLVVLFVFNLILFSSVLAFGFVINLEFASTFVVWWIATRCRIE